MSDVVVYSGPNCPYCERAKALLKKKGVAFTDYNVRADAEKFEEMLARAEGRRSIPQIFINGAPIGGCDDLYALDTAGKLNALLGVPE